MTFDTMPAEQAAICALLLEQRMKEVFDNLDSEGTGKIDTTNMERELARR